MHEKHKGISKRTLIFSIGLSIIFLFFSLRDIKWKLFWDSYFDIKINLLGLSLLLTLIMVLLRGLRSVVLIRRLNGPNRSVKKIFSSSLVGFGAILIFPLRTGEFVRPYLLSSPKKGQKDEVRMRFSSLLGVSLVERVGDGLFISLLLIGMFGISGLISFQAPAWLFPVIYFSFSIFLLGLIFLIISVTHPDKTLKIAKKLSFLDSLSQRFTSFHKLSLKFTSLFRGITHGFSVLSSKWELFIFILLTTFYWGANGLSIWFLAKAFSIQLPFWGALSVMSFIVIGIFLPSAPGFIGNFHQFARMGLVLSLHENDIEGKGMAMIFALYAVQLIIYLLSAIVGMAMGGYQKSTD